MVGHRSSHACQRGTTRSTCVCCAMTSLTRIAYGSFVFLHGRSRPFARYHAERSSFTGSREDERSAYGVVVVVAPPFTDPPVLAGRRLLQAAVAFVNVELDGEV